MPRIRDYDQQYSAGAEIGGRRAAEGDSFALPSSLGRGFAHAADILQEAADRQEVSDVQAKLAKARADWTVHLVERAQAADPGDPNFASKFNEDFEKYLSTIEGGLQTRAGQQAFQRGSAQLAGHFVAQAGVYQAKAMGAKAVQDYSVALDSHRNTLLNDPTQFTQVEAQALDALNDPNGMFARMPVAERQKLEIQTKQQLALSAVQGLIQNGAPELAQRQLQGGQWDSYLDADKKAALFDRARVAINAKSDEQERQRKLAEIERKERQEAAMKQTLARIVNPKANGGPVSDDEILRNPDLDAAHQKQMIDYKRARIKELANDAENRKNPLMVRELVNGMIAGDSDPTKTFSIDPTREAYRSGRISTPELVFLERFFNQLKDGSTNTFARDMNAAVGRAERIIASSPLYAYDPAKAITIVNQIREDALAAVEDARGKNENPRDLLNPKSPKYLFSPEKLQTYLTPASAALKADADRARQLPKAGDVVGGYRFKGGDPGKRENWEPVK